MRQQAPYLEREPEVRMGQCQILMLLSPSIGAPFCLRGQGYDRLQKARRC